MSSFFDNMITIDDALIRNDVVECYFTCDLNKCKGACCTMESEYGAPLTQEEIREINKVLPVVLPVLPESHAEEIKKNDFWEEKEGELLTRSVNNRDCVFVYYEGDIAKCALEKIYKEGKSNFLKPISCHLFPIRISKFGGDILRYEMIDQCHDAVTLGQETRLTVAQFCESSLVRLYGETWYEKLKGHIRS